MTRTDGGLLLEAHLGGRDHRLEENEHGLVYEDGRARVRLSPDGRAVLEVSALGPLAHGETVTLDACSRLVVLLNAAPATAASSSSCEVGVPSGGVAPGATLGHGGHPLIVRASVLAPFRAGTRLTLRDVLAGLGARRLRVEVADPAVALDLDRPGDVLRLTGEPPAFLPTGRLADHGRAQRTADG